MSTIILGSGIIGLSTAYYLSLSDPSHHITILDAASTLHLSASAFAGGFLASNWFSPPCSSLGALSFELHRQLAQEHDGQRRWGFMGSEVYSLSINERGVGRVKGGKKRKEERGREKEREKGRDKEGESWLEEGESRGVMAKVEKGDVLNEDGTPAFLTHQEGGTLSKIAGEEECAQVEPRLLCEFLIEECEKRGVQIKVGMKVKGVVRSVEGRMRGLRVECDGVMEELECTNLVLAAGAWTPRVFEELFPLSKKRVPIESLAGYSLVFKTPRYNVPFSSKDDITAEDGSKRMKSYAIFSAPCSEFNYAPEAFARIDASGDPEIWIGGLNNSSLPLPETADGVKPLQSPSATADLRRTTVTLSGLAKESEELNEDDLTTIREGLCFRPVSRTGLPIISNVKGEDGVWIASGHGPWGISLSLGTGKVMSEMILGQTTSADVSGHKF